MLLIHMPFVVVKSANPFVTYLAIASLIFDAILWVLGKSRMSSLQMTLHRLHVAKCLRAERGMSLKLSLTRYMRLMSIVPVLTR